MRCDSAWNTEYCRYSVRWHVWSTPYPTHISPTRCPCLLAACITKSGTCYLKPLPDNLKLGREAKKKKRAHAARNHFRLRRATHTKHSTNRTGLPLPLAGGRGVCVQVGKTPGPWGDRDLCDLQLSSAGRLRGAGRSTLKQGAWGDSAGGAGEGEDGPSVLWYRVGGSWVDDVVTTVACDMLGTIEFGAVALLSL